MSKCKILYVIDYLSLNGGVQKIVLEYYKRLNGENVHIDFIVLLEGDLDLESKIQANGSKVFFVEGVREHNIFKYYASLKKILQENNDYDIIHTHNAHFDCIQLFLAKSFQIPIRIFHAHSTSITGSVGRKIIYSFSNFIACIFATHLFACSLLAAKKTFCFFYKLKPFFVLNNAIDLKRYIYSDSARKKYKRDMGLQNNFLLCHIGRMTKEKNQMFLIDVLCELAKMDPEVKLLFIGNGPLFSEIMSYCQSRKIENNILFLGIRSDIPQLLQISDVFLLPSLYEGIPLTLIEAQASGLPIVASNTIDRSVDLTGNITFLNLNDSPQSWAKQILELKQFKRASTHTKIHDAGYDLDCQIQWIYDFYTNMVKDEE